MATHYNRAHCNSCKQQHTTATTLHEKRTPCWMYKRHRVFRKPSLLNQHIYLPLSLKYLCSIFALVFLCIFVSMLIFDSHIISHRVSVVYFTFSVNNNFLSLTFYIHFPRNIAGLIQQCRFRTLFRSRSVL